MNKNSLQETVYVNEEDRSQWVREVVTDDMWHTYEVPFYRKDGSIITVELTARAVRKSDGSIKYLEGFLEDITERNKAEEALKESEYKFRNLVETTPDMIWEIDPQGVFTYMSPQCQDIMGYSPEDIIGNSIFSIIAPEFVSRAKKILQTYIKRNKPFHTFEVLAKHRNGSLINIEIRSIMLKDNKDQLSGFRGIARDVTESKKAEEELKRVNIYNRSLIETSLDPLVTIGPDGKITDVNKATEVITGYPREILIGTDFSDYFTNPVKARRGYQRVFREGLVKDYPLKIKHKDGLVTPVLYNASIYRDGQGKVTGVFAAARDITELEKTEKRLQESQNKLKIAMNLAKLVHWEYDIELDQFTFDDQFYSLYGTTSEQEGGTTMSSAEYAQRFIPSDEASLVAIETKKAIETDDPDFQGQLEHTIIRADGEKRYITVRYGIIKDSKGRTIKTYGSNQDITERVEAERNIKNQAELLNLTREAIFVHDLDNKIIFWNDGAAEMYGWKQEEARGKVTHTLLKTKFPEPLNNIIKCLIDKGWWNGELIHTTRDGSTIISDSRWTLKKDEKGKPQSILEINTDITQRVNFQRALRESEEKFRAVADTAADAIVTIDEQGNIIYFNHSLLTIFGYNREELENRPLTVLLPEKIKKKHINGANKFKVPENLGKLRQISKTRGLKKDGKEFPMEISIAHWEFEKKPYFTAIIRDITQREQAEEELKKSEKKYHSLYSTMSEGMAIHHILYNRQGEPVDYKIMDVNPAYEKIMGLNKNEVIGRKASQIYGTIKPPYLKIYAAVAHGGEPAQFETFFKPLNKYFRISVTSPGKGIFVTIFDDITNRKKAEDEIKSSLKEKELLLQEIHHRVKNNLQIISSLLNLQENYVEEEEAVNVLRESQNRVLSMAMIHEMLYDSKDLSSIDFHGYIQHLVYDLFNSYGITSGYVKPEIKVGDIFLNIETSVPCGLIISELVSNSLKYAFPKVGGVLSVDLHLHGDEYELIIADDGVGLPEDLDYTDTESLGLRLVNSLVRQLDGTIKLDRSQGTKFTIKFTELIYKKRI
ncbi:MAG: putative diguanylate cyclase [Methanobacterium sp. PtaU1.Bin242]|nr:MAG: putative diguanylate cyclase [Methanobacterium sp. PtaU1.Bin242]